MIKRYVYLLASMVVVLGLAIFPGVVVAGFLSDNVFSGSGEDNIDKSQKNLKVGNDAGKIGRPELNDKKRLQYHCEVSVEKDKKKKIGIFSITHKAFEERITVSCNGNVNNYQCPTDSLVVGFEFLPNEGAAIKETQYRCEYGLAAGPWVTDSTPCPFNIDGVVTTRKVTIGHEDKCVMVCKKFQTVSDNCEWKKANDLEKPK